MLTVPKIFVEYSSGENQNEKVELTELLNELRSIISEFRKNQHSSTPIKKDEPLISITELAKKLNKSESTIHNWKRQRLIPFRRIGRSVFFKESEVTEALKKITEKPNFNNGI